ncbi:MAG: RNA polymerase sigma factor [Solirubrobacteraceae bacterium]
MTESPTGAQDLAARADHGSRAWLERLRSSDSEREAAIAELHGLLVRAARFEVNRRRLTFPQLRGGDLEDLAQQSADDALVAILGKLDDFRGDSRFTTWAYKFALYEAAAKVRKRAWQGREIPLTAETWPRQVGGPAQPDREAETAELLAAVGREIDESLSPHQREVLVALALNEVPIDVLAQRLSTTRGALYKTLHDTRRKLRNGLAARGLDLREHGGER